MTNRVTSFGIAALVFAGDQLTKWAVTGPAGVERLGDQLIITPFFNLTYVENRGISLGLFTADGETGRWLLVAMTAVIATLVTWWIAKERRSGDRLGLAFVLGGALGNIVDRIRLGYVVDFADLHFGAWRPFLVFNVADAAISIGVVIMLVRSFLITRRKSPESPEHA